LDSLRQIVHENIKSETSRILWNNRGKKILVKNRLKLDITQKKSSSSRDRRSHRFTLKIREKHHRIAVDGDGNAISVWVQNDGERYNIWSNRYDVNLGWQTAKLIETDSTGSAWNPIVSVDKGGNAIAIWRFSSGAKHIWANEFKLQK